MDMLGGEGVAKQCRKADIMADAAYAILSKPKEYTGHFLVDEDVLREQGVQDFEAYAVQPGEKVCLSRSCTAQVMLTEASDWSTGHPLLPDFFLDETPEVLVQQMEQHGESCWGSVGWSSACQRPRPLRTTERKCDAFSNSGVHQCDARGGAQ